MKFKYILLLTGILFALTGCGHEHSYTTERIEPTCVTVGYDVYTCECGHSYNEQLEILEHTYTTKESEDFCRTIYTCACGDTYEEDSYIVMTCDETTMYATGDIVTYNGPSEFYGVNEKTFVFNDEVKVTGSFNTFVELDVDGTKLYIKEGQLDYEKYVEPEVQSATKPTNPTKPSKPQTSRPSLEDQAAMGFNVDGATISDGHVDGYTSQEETEALSDGFSKDWVWN